MRTALTLALFLLLTPFVSASDPCPSGHVCLPADVLFGFDIERPTVDIAGIEWKDDATEVYEGDVFQPGGQSPLPFSQCATCGAVQFSLLNHGGAHIDDANGTTVETFTCADIAIKWFYGYPCEKTIEHRGITTTFWTMCEGGVGCYFDACICV